MSSQAKVSGTPIILGVVAAGIGLWAAFSASAAEPPPLPPLPPPPPEPPMPGPFQPSTSVPGPWQPPAARALPPPSTSTTEAQESIPSHSVQVVQATPPTALPAAQTPPPAAKPAPAATRSPRQAATDLYAYVVPLVRAGDSTALGVKGHPSNFIAAAQRDMRLIASDGIYGPKTMARGKELLGREFPPRTAKRVAPSPPPEPVVPALKVGPATFVPAAPPPVPPSVKAMTAPPVAPPPPSVRVNQTSPREAATALYALVKTPPVHWGTKANPNQLILAAQRDMGGLVPDGIYGPATRKRGKELLGMTFPPRK